MAQSPGLRLTREGWYWLLGCVTLSLTGLLRGINLLTLLGCMMLVVWALHMVSSLRSLHGLTGRRLLDAPIFAQAPFTLRAEIHNQHSRPRAGLVLQETGPSHPVGWGVPVLPGGARQRVTDQLLCSRRGRSFLGPLIVSTSLPFGLMTRSAVLAPREDFIVLPRLGTLHRGKLRHYLARSASAAGGARHVSRHHALAQADLHGLRAFRSGDNPRWIHLRTTARRGELMVREMHDTTTDNLVLILDPSIPQDRESVEHFEKTISLAATICWEWCRQTGDRMILVAAGTPPVVVEGVTGRDLALRMLQCLAVQTGGAAVETAGLLAAVNIPTAPVLVVGAGPTSLAATLGKELRRPIACVNVADGDCDEFFESP